MSTQKHYFLGNAAKSRVVGLILERARRVPESREFLVFDHGCGGGGDWPDILDDNPFIRYVGYDPDPRSLRRAFDRLQGRKARFLSADELDGESISA
ncbi:MAG: class I SAM-dependent methyltransferase, partial [Alphaproteobacteria bacterium]